MKTYQGMTVRNTPKEIAAIAAYKEARNAMNRANRKCGGGMSATRGGGSFVAGRGRTNNAHGRDVPDHLLSEYCSAERAFQDAKSDLECAVGDANRAFKLADPVYQERARRRAEELAASRAAYHEQCGG